MSAYLNTQQSKVSGYYNSSSGYLIISLGGCSNVIRGVERENTFIFAFKSMKSQGTLGNHLKCFVTVKSHLFFCHGGSSWRPRFVNSNKYSVYKEESLQGKKKSIKEK